MLNRIDTQIDIKLKFGRKSSMIIARYGLVMYLMTMEVTNNYSPLGRAITCTATRLKDKNLALLALALL